MSRKLVLVVMALCGVMACRREPPPGDSKPRSARATSAVAAASSGTQATRPLPNSGSQLDAGRLDAAQTAEEMAESYAVPNWSEAELDQRTPPTDGPRYYVKNRHVWIYPEPNIALQWVGFLWTGGSVRLKSTRPIYGPGCTFYYKVQPWGFICTDGNRGTIDPNDKLYGQLLRYSARTDSPWPHRYGRAKELTRYFSFPDTPGPRNLDAGAASDPPNPIDFSAVSPGVHEAHTSLIDRSTVAYTVETRRNGQDWLLTSDYALIAKDKITPYPNSQFHGVHLRDKVSLPLAFFKGSDRPRYAMTAPGHFEAAGKPYARLSYVSLTGQRQRAESEDWFETSDGGWVKASDATVPTPTALTPWGVAIGDEKITPETPKGRATWIEVSIVSGWLIAYEGTRPVFVTLISPGSGGMPRKGQAAIDTFSTPLGRFQINGKFVSSTMIGPTGLIHSEVPYAQNFAELYAIHTAYWHDNWGNPMSGGCINVSPIDGYFLFHWTEPAIPEGWYGVRWIASREPSTIVIIHR